MLCWIANTTSVWCTGLYESSRIEKHARCGIRASGLNRCQKDQSNVKFHALLFEHPGLVSRSPLVCRRLHAKTMGMTKKQIYTTMKEPT